MLSAKVICAIQILRELAVRKNQSEDLGLKTAELKQFGTFQDLHYPLILARLLAKGYIDKSGGRHRLLVDLEQISLEDLIDLYHGGVVVGEVYIPQPDRFFRYGSKYQRLVQTEQTLSKQIKEQFESISLSQLLF